MPFCKHCGKENSVGATFCGGCGQKIEAAPVQAQVVYTNTPPVAQPQQKSKIAAGLLGLFVGGLGIHNFYLGYTGRAVAQLVMWIVTIVSCGFIPLAIVTCIWSLVESIMIFCGSINVDGHGVPLKD
ncbi:MAG: zinc ribbon domain-containing protein [Clostridia bacterium]|nr:zinc ribbon domain-containing protein [Oscillospiraceae bacterium]MBQ7960709.1 zinc ribbon domain-containing protein [Clostridia bacterium]